MKTFELTDEQEKTFFKWYKKKKLPNDAAGVNGGSYSFEFTPTSIGTIVTGKCMDGTEIDLTDTDNW